MEFRDEKIIAGIYKGKNTEIIVREEINEYEEVVTDIRLRNNVDGTWKYSKHGIIYPSTLNPQIIDALMKTLY